MYYGTGDYYVGDPGIFGSIGRAIGGAVTGFVGGGPLGGIRGAIGGLTRKKQQVPPPMTRFAPRPTMMIPGPSVFTRAAQAAIPGGKTGYEVYGRKRKRMNYTNAKALRRANRRRDGFIKIARQSLKGTGYKIVSSASRSGARRVSIRESGAGGVTVGR